ncbi:hypothetical protein DX928_22220 [Bacillus swezeyi]|nr:hypothetical protein DX928_22220 [Bacillus swezeyi]
MRGLNVSFQTHYEQGSKVRCLYIDVFRFRILTVYSDTVWYTKGKTRKVPVWISDNGLFFYKLAIRIGIPKTKRRCFDD